MRLSRTTGTSLYVTFEQSRADGCKNRDKSQTLSQNYQRLGLSSRLNASSWCAPASSAFTPSVAPKVAPKKLQPGEAKIIRDEKGAIVRIEHAPTAEDVLDDDEWTGFADDNAGELKTEVVRQLEALAASEVKTERTQSEREREWIESLVAKYGRDFKKMSRDRKLNPFQQTEGDIRRRVAKWEKKYGGAMVETPA
ncbi:ribosome biogenesis protein Nop16 [Sphaerosporella brunnea]|uniref:Nucleolar protein 16 n=1 Tax=Sphaerosporella brunnea TaxID=1250544 RepID=A0A5J5F720_9PEZI|nr:ribosome biogenesis protein Nop16 [Sphaerosporella brunnea]